MTQIEPLIEESIDVDAQPATVWTLVTDLPRMASWSPQVVRTVVRGGPVALGDPDAEHQPPRPPGVADPVQGRALRAAPGLRLPRSRTTTRSGPSRSSRPTTGTRVVQRREAPNGTTRISDTLDPPGDGRPAVSSRASCASGMQQTLRRLKVDAEA